MSSYEIFERLPFIGVLVVRRRSIVFANGAMERILGWGAAELAEAPLSVIFSESAFENFQEPLSQVETGNFPALQSEIPCRCRDGKDVYCLLSTARGPDGAVVISLQNAENGSAIDFLTGLHMRKAFFVLAEHERATAERLKKEVYLFFIDVDGLKEVNDSLGHAAGDDLLRVATDVLKKSFRASDVIVRFGGDEFAVLALSELEGKDEILQRVKKIANQASRELMDKRGFALSLSVGVVRCDPKQTLQSVLEEADRQMYEEKKKKKEKIK